MNLPKKIVTADDIVSRVLKFDYYTFIYCDSSMEELRRMTLEHILKAWDYVINLEDKSMKSVLNFFGKYDLTEEQIVTLQLMPPDKELLELAGLPQDILDRVDTGYAMCKDSYELLQKQVKLQEQKQEILDYLEILVFENKIKIIGEWQGDKTRIIISNWEEIEQLFNTNLIPKDIAELYEKTAKEIKTGKNNLLIYLYSMQGMSRQSIAEKLGLSPVTKNNISIRKKAGQKKALELNLPDLEQYNKE